MQPSILDRINWRFWRSTRTRISKKFRAYSISHRNWCWSILKKFWMWIRLTVHLLHGRDHCCPHDQVIQWVKAKVHVHSDSALCLGRMNDSKDTITRWERSSRRIQKVPFLQRIAGNRWRSNWIRVEYFPKIFIIADSTRDPEWFAKTEHQTWKVHRPDHL